MKKRFISTSLIITTVFFVFIILSNCSFKQIPITNSYSLNCNNNISKNIKNDTTKTNKISENENVGLVTLFVNNTNNIIAAYGILLAIVTILIAVVGYFSVKPLIDRMNNFRRDQIKFKREINSKIIEIKNTEKNFTEKMNLLDQIEKKNKIQNLYIDKSIKYLYEYIITMANQPRHKDKKIIERIHTDTQLLRLYSLIENDQISALQYFSENGNSEHISDIKEISEITSNEDIKILALQIIGRIEERNSNNNQVL